MLENPAPPSFYYYARFTVPRQPREIDAFKVIYEAWGKSRVNVLNIVVHCCLRSRLRRVIEKYSRALRRQIHQLPLERLLLGGLSGS